jgi:hypothetical protein
MPGIALIRDITTTFSPLFLEITRRGRNTLNILKTLIKDKSTDGKEYDITAETTIRKSSTFQAYLI